MGLTLQQKQESVAHVSAQLAKAQAVIVAEYRGLEVGAMTGLRAKARGAGVYLRVLKNTLARRAVKGTHFEKLSEQMSGPLIYGFAQDPIAVALSAKYKDIPMPNLRLSNDEIDMVLSYLEAQGRAAPERAGQASTSPR